MNNNLSKNTTEAAKTKASQNFGLSEAVFNEMLQKMKKGNDELFEKIFLAQFEETISYLMHRYNVTQSMAYDATMDALLNFRKRLLNNKITYYNMRFLFTKIAGQFLVKYLKQNNASVTIHEQEDIVEVVEEVDNTVLDYLDIAWIQLDKKCSKLLEDYYYKKIAIKELAKKIGKSDVALRKQKQRCLKTLRIYFLKLYK